MQNRCTIDFETRSQADLRKIGAWNYSVHPSTEILCLAYTEDGENVPLWRPTLDPPDVLHAWIRRMYEVEAWNSYFEYCIYLNICVKRFGWPAIADEQWRCALAKAAAHALPKKLEKAALALGTKNQKDALGHRVMLKCSKPRKPTKNNPSIWHESPADLQKIYEYCVMDVKTEHEISSKLRDLSPHELEVWRLDQKINRRGIGFDRELAKKAIAIGKQAVQAANAELVELTGGVVRKTGDRVAFRNWLRTRGVTPPTKINAEKETIETTETKSLQKLLVSGIPDPTAKRAVELWIKANKSTIKKYDAMMLRASDDDRIRETLQYHAASTGRFGGRGIQPQNMFRPPDDLSDMDRICGDILDCDYEGLCLLYGPDRVLEVLASATRGALVAGPGHVLQAADFSAIETRGAGWLAGDIELLETFRELDRLGPEHNEDIYTRQAGQLLGRHVTKKDKTERQNWGKVPTLACVYGASGKAVVKYADGMGLVLERKVASQIVKAWRAARAPIVRCWKACEEAAMEAIRKRHLKERLVEQGPFIKWKVVGRFLHCRLPNGRLLSYLDPKIEMRKIVVEIENDEGEVVEVKEFWKDAITFQAEDTYTKKWKRCSTYGSKLFENLVQAICRDLMVDGMLRAEAAGYPIVLTVHDELVADLHPSFGSNDEFVRLMSVVPDWAPGFPVAVSGEYRARRYTK